MSSGGGTIHEGALLGDVCSPSWTYVHWESSVSPIGSVVPQVEAPSNHYSSSLHSLVPVEH